MAYTPDTDGHSNQACSERNPVGSTVAAQTFCTVAVACWGDGGMCIIDGAVDMIEDEAGSNGCKGHGTPVLGESVNTEGFGNKGWVDSKEEAVCHCRTRLGFRTELGKFKLDIRVTYDQWFQTQKPGDRDFRYALRRFERRRI